MPNWCMGNIRFRGTKRNIKSFLMNEIVSCRMVDHETVEEKPIFKDDDYLLIIKKPYDHSWFYIKGTHRNFIETDEIEVWLDEDDEEKEIIVCIDDYQVAWSFERNDVWRDIAKKYCFDVKMTGYEKGMHFSQVKIYYRDGITTKEEVKEYSGDDDWMWNCPMPNYGG